MIYYGMVNNCERSVSLSDIINMQTIFNCKSSGLFPFISATNHLFFHPIVEHSNIEEYIHLSLIFDKLPKEQKEEHPERVEKKRGPV